MNKLFRHIIILLTTIVLFSACAREADLPRDGEETPGDGSILQVELFTQAYDFSTPVVTRADEDYVDDTPWVFVFKDNGSGSYIFEEMVKAYCLPSNNPTRTFVNLKPQTAQCRLLILANPQHAFYLQNDGTTADTLYDIESKIEEIKGALDGKTLEYVCSHLFTVPLGSQTGLPFTGESLPMSYLSDPTTISAGIKLGDADNKLELTRAVAKVIVMYAPSTQNSDFTFSGISVITNVSNRGLLHNLSGETPNGVEMTSYRPAAGTENLVNATNIEGQYTIESPIYLYESSAGNETGIIIKGVYDEVEYYYKMSVIDNDGNCLNILRNHQYIFTITNVGGKGYDTLEDAIASRAINTNLDFEIKVINESAFEIIANNDYYLAVSNSVFIAYTNDARTIEFEAFTWFTDCTRNFPNSNKISDNFVGADWAMKLSSTTANLDVSGNFYYTVPTFDSESNSYVTDPVYVNIGNWLVHSDGTAYVTLKLGNLEKKVLIRQRSAIPAAGETLKYFPTSSGEALYYSSLGQPMNTNEVKYYCLSGFVDVPNITNWITLTSSSGATGSNITVDDGVIHIVIGENGTNEERTGIVYLTTIDDPYNPVGINSVKRIKLSITQLGQQTEN